jgi:hypothetical protein
MAIDPRFWPDLAPYLQRHFIRPNGGPQPDPAGRGRFAPPVRIALAFLKFISHVVAALRAAYEIPGFDDMDPFSQNLIRHAEKSCQNLVIQFV